MINRTLSSCSPRSFLISTKWTFPSEVSIHSESLPQSKDTDLILFPPNKFLSASVCRVTHSSFGNLNNTMSSLSDTHKSTEERSEELVVVVTNRGYSPRLQLHRGNKRACLITPCANCWLQCILITFCCFWALFMLGRRWNELKIFSIRKT